jgi:hypothetical protein
MCAAAKAAAKRQVKKRMTVSGVNIAQLFRLSAAGRRETGAILRKKSPERLCREVQDFSFGVIYKNKGFLT